MSDSTLENGATQASDESVISISAEVENGKNKHLVKCQFCPSHILNSGLGIYSQSEFDLPMMTKRKKQSQQESKEESETLTYFWKVNDMYTFENIGFSNTIGDIKYLACADCEIGPIGYYNINTKVSYVALARVCHVN